MKKRILTAALLTVLAATAAWQPLRDSKGWIVRTVAATLMQPVIAAQSADAAAEKPEGKLRNGCDVRPPA